MNSDLAGAWRVEDIAGRGVLDRVQPVLEFVGSGTVKGTSGCNNVFGQIKMTGGVLKIGPLAMTRKACPPAIMDQERKFMEAVQSVTGYRAENQELHLFNSKAEEVLLLRHM